MTNAARCFVRLFKSHSLSPPSSYDLWPSHVHWDPPEGTTRIVPVVQIVPKKIDARKTAIDYKKIATVAKDGKGDRGDREARASQSLSPGDQLVVKQEPTKNYLVVLGKAPV